MGHMNPIVWGCDTGGKTPAVERNIDMGEHFP